MYALFKGPELASRRYHAATALKFAILTDRKHIPASTKRALKPFIAKYF
jgi:hypothetical protein